MNAAHASLRELEESESIEWKDKEKDQDEVHELKVAEQTRRKEQLESGKSEGKNHDEGKNMGKDRILEHQPKYFPPQ